MAEGGGPGEGGRNHVEFHPPSLWRVLDFKRKSADFDKFLKSKTFGLQLFVPIESFPIHVSDTRPCTGERIMDI